MGEINESAKMVMVLVIVSVLSAASLSLVYEQTKPIIEEKKLGELKNSLEEVMPYAARFKESDKFEEVISDDKGGIKKVFNAYDKDDEQVGIVLLMDGMGFGGTIKILVGIDINSKEITGTKILEHLETPGLGERVTENEFLEQFTNKPITLQKNEIDSITGATISSTAVIKTITENTNRISGYITLKSIAIENATN